MDKDLKYVLSRQYYQNNEYNGGHQYSLDLLGDKPFEEVVRETEEDLRKTSELTIINTALVGHYCRIWVEDRRTEGKTLVIELNVIYERDLARLMR